MADFDIKAARLELDDLKKRAREMETEINAALKQRLQALSFALHDGRELTGLLDDVRRFVDERA